MKHQERLQAVVKSVVGRVGELGPTETATHLPVELERFALKIARAAWAEARRRMLEECIAACEGAENDFKLQAGRERGGGGADDWSSYVDRTEGAAFCARRLRKKLVRTP